MYQGKPTDLQTEEPATGILIANLGTPESPTFWALRRYLAEFLADPRVIELPHWLWMLVLHGIVLNVRPGRSAEAYGSIWTEEGSPLMVLSEEQVAALTPVLEARFEGPVKVALGMRYGEPSIANALADLREANARRILILPLYPQYSATTVGTVLDAAADALKKWRWLPDLRFISHYHEHPGYIRALATSIREHWAEHGQPEKLVMSFHGLPESYFTNGDPYYCECQRTARLLADELGIPDEAFVVAYQSRLGPIEWLRPYLDETLRVLPAQGVRDVQVVCPGFSVDCLETLEEVAIEGKETFLEAGGERFSYIPALNAREDHIAMMADLITTHTTDWLHQACDQRYCFAVGGICEACGDKPQQDYRAITG